MNGLSLMRFGVVSIPWTHHGYDPLLLSRTKLVGGAPDIWMIQDEVVSQENRCLVEVSCLTGDGVCPRYTRPFFHLDMH